MRKSGYNAAKIKVATTYMHLSPTPTGEKSTWWVDTEIAYVCNQLWVVKLTHL